MQPSRELPQDQVFFCFISFCLFVFCCFFFFFLVGEQFFSLLGDRGCLETWSLSNWRNYDLRHILCVTETSLVQDQHYLFFPLRLHGFHTQLGPRSGAWVLVFWMVNGAQEWGHRHPWGRTNLRTGLVVLCVNDSRGCCLKSWGKPWMVLVGQQWRRQEIVFSWKHCIVMLQAHMHINGHRGEHGVISKSGRFFLQKRKRDKDKNFLGKDQKCAFHACSGCQVTSQLESKFCWAKVCGT